MAIDLQFVMFRVGAQSYALPITAVREIVRVPEITAVPQSPDFVAGVMNLRGKIVPIIDLRKRFQKGYPAPGASDRPEQPIESSPKNRILVLLRDGKPLGMLVDSASEVVKIEPAQIEPASKLFGDSTETYVNGVAKHHGRLLVLLDAERLLPQIEKETVVA